MAFVRQSSSSFIPKMESRLESVPTTCRDLLPEKSRSLCLYGVDWSNNAHPTSHSWCPYSSKNKCECHLCVHESLCSLIVHLDHLIDGEETTNPLVGCRSSFVEVDNEDEIVFPGEHQWSSWISNRSESCEYCQRKMSLGNVKNVDPRSSGGIKCLYCARKYHQRCWEKMKENEENQCDYGVLGEMFVRPDWFHRVRDSPTGFRVQMFDHSVSVTPVIFFINKTSGGQKGEKICRRLLRLLNPRQVFLLENDETIDRALEMYSSLVNTRICICGGDGTVGWVLNRLLQYFPSLKNPPSSICPLGTGNDLSRVLGWGYQYKPKKFIKMLTQIPRAQPVALDRWQIEIESLPNPMSTVSDDSNTRQCLFFMQNHPKFIRHADQSVYENHRTPTRTHFFNYMSFGLDAAVVLDFHARRTADSTQFTSPLKNKILYLNEARKYFNDFAFGMRWTLGRYIRLICDGTDLTDSIQSCHTLVLLNITSFGSGTHPWNNLFTNITQSRSNYNVTETNDSCTMEINNETLNHFQAQDIGDGIIEVLSLTSTQMAFIHLGFQGHRIAQCRQVRIELTHPMPVHMDGDPFYLPGSISLNVKHAGQVMVLTK